MDFRVEHDSMGEVRVPAEKYWGAQTERSRNNFVSGEIMPLEVIYAIAEIKKAAALANFSLQRTRMTEEKCRAIVNSCDEILSGALDDNFPLVVFQTGSGTQTNMNVNEVIANFYNLNSGKKLLHPNDDVNMSQSSNDVFPTAMHLAAAKLTKFSLIPALDGLVDTFRRLEEENVGVVKCGRTHLQDATPILFSQEISGWRGMIETDISLISDALVFVTSDLAIGGTAVGTGINCPKGFDAAVVKELSEMIGINFAASENKFASMTSKNALVFLHGAIKATACDLMKIANDIRLLASGPRCGIGEISIPSCEPGSSIMPGKVNPTQCEAVTMAACRVIGNDTAISLAASQGNFQLNVFMPLIISSVISSLKLLSGCVASFNKNCVAGICANREKMAKNLEISLMLVTSLTPRIGYENASRVAKKASDDGITLKEACISLGYISAEEFESIVRPEEMV